MDFTTVLALQIILELDRTVVYLVNFFTIQSFMNSCICTVELFFVDDILDMFSTVVEIVSECIFEGLELTLLVIPIYMDIVQALVKGAGNSRNFDILF